MLFVGCAKTHNKYTVAKVLQEFSESTAYDLNYSIDVEASGNLNLTQEIREITKKDGDNTTSIIEIDKGNEFQYITNGYIYTKRNNRYSIKSAADIDNENLTPDLSDGDFDNSEIEETENEIIYTVKYNGSDVSEIIESILGDVPKGMTGEMNVEIKIDKTSESLKSIDMDISLTQDSNFVNLRLLIEINAIGDEVNVEIPDIIRQRIETYINSEDEEEFVSYDEPDDGVLSFIELGDFKQVLYDDITNQLILLRDSTIEFYDLDNLNLLKTITPFHQPVCADVTDGKLVVGFDVKYVTFYDLSNNYETLNFPTEVKVNELALDEDYLIYADHNGWNEDMVFENIYNRNKRYMRFYQGSSFALNKEDHMVYISQVYEAYFYNLHGSVVNITDGTEAYSSIFFDGKSVYYDGKTYDPLDGSLISSMGIKKIYPLIYGSNPSLSLYDSSKVAIIETNDSIIGVYDNAKSKFIYSFYNYDSDSNYVLKLSDGKYLVISKDNKNVALIDLSVLDENLIKDDEVEDDNNQEEGDVQTFKVEYYTKSIADDKYIYTLNKHTKELNVYDIITLENVYYEYYYETPTSVDVDSGRLVIGFGEQSINYGDTFTIKLYDITTWDCENIAAQAQGQSLYIYKDYIFYRSSYTNDFHLQDINTHEDTKYDVLDNFGGYKSQTISKGDGIMYFGGSYKDLIYFNLDTKEIIKSVSITSSDPISFDGEYIHFDGKTLDRLTGELVDSHDIAFSYAHGPYYSPKTLYYDNEIIVYIGEYTQDEYYTVVHDLSSDTLLYEIKGRNVYVKREGNKLYLFNDSSDTIRVVDLIKTDAAFSN